MTTTVADPTAREFLRNADPVLARLIDAQPNLRPRTWTDELPGLDDFGTLTFQVTGQQLPVRRGEPSCPASKTISEDTARLTPGRLCGVTVRSMETTLHRRDVNVEQSRASRLRDWRSTDE
jgi:hypothetical protein